MTIENKSALMALLGLVRDDMSARQALYDALRRRVPTGDRAPVAALLNTSAVASQFHDATAALNLLIVDVQGAV